MKRFIMDCLVTFLRIVVADIVTVLSLLILFSKNTETWLTDFGFRGAIIMLLICFIISIFYNIYLLYRMRANYSDLKARIDALADGKIEQIEGRELRESFNQLSEKTVNDIFKMFSFLIAYPNGTPKVNIHYFEYQTLGGIEFLVKIRKYCFESELRPVDYTLERIRLGARGMVVCKAYNNNTVIFEDITQDHINQYEDDLKDHVDTQIKWVLTSPVWRENNTDTNNRKGVVCIFGNGEIPNDYATHEKLKMLCLELSTCISAFV